MPDKAVKAVSENKDAVQPKVYNPDEKEKKIITDSYASVTFMIDGRNKAWPEFNMRTLAQFIDDGDKRLNPYVLPRESYDPPKEDWQSNVPLPVIRDKQKKILAGFSLDVPDMSTKAFGDDNALDVNRAEIAKWLIKGSYEQEENSVLENFWESWECARAGTVIKYEGYLRTQYKQKFITSYDAETGKVEYVERDVVADDKCVSYQVPITEFYIYNFSVQDVQDQPEIAWVRYYSEEDFEAEFGKYPNAKHVKTKGAMTEADTRSFFYQNQTWVDRTGKDQIEVVRLYKKGSKEHYRIVANGVLILDAPLLWSVNGVKVYPFAKTIWEPFVDRQFFYGNSFPNIMAALYDSFNTTFNTMSDKQFRSMMPGMLVGRINQDALDLEDQFITGSTKISVEDVNQVKPVPVEGINQSDILLFRILQQALEDAAPSLPGLMQGKNPTAREVVIANEKLDEMKSIYSEMLKDLWRQKYYLRLANIQLNYPQPKIIVEKDPKTGEDKEVKLYRTYIIPDAELDTKKGERGILAIQFRDIPKNAKEKKKLADDIAVEEEVMKNIGQNFRKLIVPRDYLDNKRYQIEMVDGAVMRRSRGVEQAVVLEKLGVISKMFPQIFVLMQDDYFEQVSRAYGENPAKAMQKLAEFKKSVDELKANAAQGQGAPADEPQGQPAPVAAMQ